MNPNMYLVYERRKCLSISQYSIFRKYTVVMFSEPYLSCGQLLDLKFAIFKTITESIKSYWLKVKGKGRLL